MSRCLLLLAMIVVSLPVWAADVASPEKPAAVGPVSLFPRQSWLPPPLPAPPPPKPVAPPLPFQYRGSLLDDGKVTVFLAQQMRQILVKEGDVIDNTYRVDGISPQSVAFTYLPLNEKQQLSTGRNQ
ncbi:hypothetical protein [Dechloromonas sp. HYN0024]|uniref:hypothetical protein n=1 Tax=Dechloromonas sp. HYN0024 TaxID=2231055 RepID=UPI0013C370DA|nr:hypothetical protein [Dechloromonas sp. HYN0024]